MISKRDLEKLLEWGARPGSPVLSVYLDIDQTQPVNLKRGFETTLKTMLRSIEQQLEDEYQREAFAEDTEGIVRYVFNYTPNAQSLVLFCDASEDFFWARELRTKLRNEAHWSDTPYLRPLLEVLNDFERYGVILADREHARLFTAFLGEIQEHHETFAPVGAQHVKTTGTDHIWSQKNFQRKADAHAYCHLKQVADLMAHLVDARTFDRLVLAGPIETTRELYHLLPKRLQSRVVASIPLPLEAHEQQVLEATRKIEQEAGRLQEGQLVEELIAGEQAVTGLASTLVALQERRVWRLVYAERWTAKGWQCDSCSTLFAEEQTDCAYCDAPVQAVDDLVECVAERVVEMGGKVERVRDEAADRLRAVGGIGAYLRF